MSAVELRPPSGSCRATRPTRPTWRSAWRLRCAEPDLGVSSVKGLYDMATPFFGTEYDLGDMQLDRSLISNLRFAFTRRATSSISTSTRSIPCIPTWPACTTKPRTAAAATTTPVRVGRGKGGIDMQTWLDARRLGRCARRRAPLSCPRVMARRCRRSPAHASARSGRRKCRRGGHRRMVPFAAAGSGQRMRRPLPASPQAPPPAPFEPMLPLSSPLP